MISTSPPHTTAVLFLVLMSVPAAAGAQPRLGFHVGLALSTFGGPDAADPGSRTGVTGGGSVTIPLSTVANLRVGAGYTEKGAQDQVEEFNVRLALSYFEFPVLLKLNVPSSANVGAFGVLGPILGLKMRCDVTVSSQQTSSSAECDSPLFGGELATKTADVGLLFGGGLDVGLHNRIQTTLLVSYTLGIPSFFEFDQFDVRHRSLAFVAGISFPLGRTRDSAGTP